MSTDEGPSYTYEQFADFVRRYDQAQLLAEIAQRAIRLPDNPSQQRYLWTPPWELAAVAKACLCYGNPHRTTPPKRNTLNTAVNMYKGLAPDELRRPELSSGFAVLARIAYEQFPYQESVAEEIARPVTFFDDYSGRKGLEVLSSETLQQLLGAPITRAIGTAIVLYTLAEKNGGYFDPSWLDQDAFAGLLEEIPKGEMLQVINTVFTNTLEAFRAQASEAEILPFLPRYQFNPLTDRPFVKFDDGRMLAPVPRLILRKLSPLELYYQGIHRFGLAFARDMGELVEDYVGRQLEALPRARVHAEVAYKVGRDRVTSVDWIVVLERLVLLVEAKAARATASARAATPDITQVYDRTLGKAFRQINRTHQAIMERTPGFEFVPRDRPIFGIVATLDPWYMANSLARSFLPSVDVVTMVASVREIEHLVAIGQRRPADEVLGEVLADPERRTWELATALRPYGQRGDKNPLLQSSWERFPFDDSRDGA